MLRLKLEIEQDDMTMESGKQFQMLAVRLEKQSFSSSNTARNLTNLNELSRV